MGGLGELGEFEVKAGLKGLDALEGLEGWRARASRLLFIGVGDGKAVVVRSMRGRSEMRKGFGQSSN